MLKSNEIVFHHIDHIAASCGLSTAAALFLVNELELDTLENETGIHLPYPTSSRIYKECLIDLTKPRKASGMPWIRAKILTLADAANAINCAVEEVAAMAVNRTLERIRISGETLVTEASVQWLLQSRQGESVQ